MIISCYARDDLLARKLAEAIEDHGGAVISITYDGTTVGGRTWFIVFARCRDEETRAAVARAIDGVYRSYPARPQE
jgi:hypothetical protein